MINFADVRDEINTLFLAAWQANTAAIAGYVPDIYWQGVQSPIQPDGSKFWIRLSKQNVIEQQAALSTCVGAPGQRMYEASGLVFVQLFCPKSTSESFDLGQKLAVVARDAFRGKSTANNIWFRNVRINELEPEELYYRFNVVSEYEYNEIG
jgi:hypothetical protein